MPLEVEYMVVNSQQRQFVFDNATGPFSDLPALP